jgi:hypothetical protein
MSLGCTTVLPIVTPKKQQKQKSLRGSSYTTSKREEVRPGNTAHAHVHLVPHLMFLRSMSNRSLSPGRCTLTTTRSPLFRVARCTCRHMDTGAHALSEWSQHEDPMRALKTTCTHSGGLILTKPLHASILHAPWLCAAPAAAPPSSSPRTRPPPPRENSNAPVRVKQQQWVSPQTLQTPHWGGHPGSPPGYAVQWTSQREARCPAAQHSTA